MHKVIFFLSTNSTTPSPELPSKIFYAYAAYGPCVCTLAYIPSFYTNGCIFFFKLFHLILFQKQVIMETCPDLHKSRQQSNTNSHVSTSQLQSAFVLGQSCLFSISTHLPATPPCPSILKHISNIILF